MSKWLEIGAKIEMEHTKDIDKARKIAQDHLNEDPDYYKDWDNKEKILFQEKAPKVEKYDRVDEEADGKKELDYGKEELDKRWGKLKKAVLDNTAAIMPLEDQEYQDDETVDDEGSTQETPVDDAGDDEADVEQEGAQDQLSSEEDPEGESDNTEELTALLREEGYGDAEIAHILHGHIMPEATVDDIKVDSEQAMSEHKLGHQQRMDDLDYQLASHEHETNGLDRDHKKRMLDLEFEYAKKEKDLELDHKKQELELKLKTQKEKAQKAKEATTVRDTGRSRSQDASKTSKKEKAGK